MKEKFKTPEEEKAYVFKQIERQLKSAKLSIGILSDIRDRLDDIAVNTEPGYGRKSWRIKPEYIFRGIVLLVAIAAYYITSTLF